MSLNIVYCTLHIAHCILHIVHCTLHIVHCTLLCTLYIAHCTLHIADLLIERVCGGEKLCLSIKSSHKRQLTMKHIKLTIYKPTILYLQPTICNLKCCYAEADYCGAYCLPLNAIVARLITCIIYGFNEIYRQYLNHLLIQ